MRLTHYKYFNASMTGRHRYALDGTIEGELTERDNRIAFKRLEGFRRSRLGEQNKMIVDKLLIHAKQITINENQKAHKQLKSQILEKLDKYVNQQVEQAVNRAMKERLPSMVNAAVSEAMNSIKPTEPKNRAVKVIIPRKTRKA